MKDIDKRTIYKYEIDGAKYRVLTTDNDIDDLQIFQFSEVDKRWYFIDHDDGYFAALVRILLEEIKNE